MIHCFNNLSPQLGEKVYIAPGAHVIGEVEIGAYVSIWFNSVVRGDVHWIKIGQGTNIQDNSVIHVTRGQSPCSIGNNVTVGHSCIVHACEISDDVLIGMGSIILDRAKIGKNTLIGAGSLVKESDEIPEGVLAFGRPAKVIRLLSEEEILGIKKSAQHYVELSQQYLSMMVKK